jgi:ElaA protein
VKFYTAPFSDIPAGKLYRILALRSDVFVVEQNCAYQDLDGKDEQSIWVWAEDETGNVHATARLLPAGISYNEISIGRVCTSMESRRTGLGKSLMEECLNQCELIWGKQTITISAQQYLLKFYNELGFFEEGEMYLEDDIPHLKMKRKA